MVGTAYGAVSGDTSRELSPRRLACVEGDGLDEVLSEDTKSRSGSDDDDGGLSIGEDGMANSSRSASVSPSADGLVVEVVSRTGIEAALTTTRW